MVFLVEELFWIQLRKVLFPPKVVLRHNIPLVGHPHDSLAQVFSFLFQGWQLPVEAEVCVGNCPEVLEAGLEQEFDRGNTVKHQPDEKDPEDIF